MRRDSYGEPRRIFIILRHDHIKVPLNLNVHLSQFFTVSENSDLFHWCLKGL
jgi:hypothetical protein